MTSNDGSSTSKDVQVKGPALPGSARVLTEEALAFVADLESKFGGQRRELLSARENRQEQFDRGVQLGFLPETKGLRDDGSWKVAAAPVDLSKRRVEITGPTERKMMINALNSGASVFMADFEDANSPTWQNMIEGQVNLMDAVEGVISFTSQEGKEYRLNKHTAVLVVRPRGWHLEEKHLHMDGQPVSGSLFDFGLYFFHNAKKLLEKGSGPYFYLPKLQSHLEARLWNDVFNHAQDVLNIPRGSIRATVLIETILAVFEMEEILYELREHSSGLNAGRWDYIFSAIKTFRRNPEIVFPDRSQITMTSPFMRAYTELLVRTCHKRGAHAIGGMAAYIPSKRDPDVNDKALAKVQEDKERESRDGFDGTWVAHPDLVPVAMEVFDRVLGDRPHQLQQLREDVQVRGEDLLNFSIPGGEITEEGLRTNVNVGLQYLETWLRGSGAVAIYNLMEDTATAEICRAQVWQWAHSPRAKLTNGLQVTPDLIRQIIPEELDRIKTMVGEAVFLSGKFDLAAQLFEKLALEDEFVEFLTLAAYDYL